ncbi:MULTISPECIES: hypothetical protein [Larkinella]|jgi:hypothetical protein|uniref:Uncharacterized protein n=1 Tax=Larkinella punicea TaxID=2315727 RepID=A0A368JK43_9BACT|nr:MULTISPECIES: hypothetical protein [Larkinella]RCR67054.1 hypothetical protein DUE52_23650 [Larkinella punicea]
MKKVSIWLVGLLFVGLSGCNKEPEPDLPAYLVMPSNLASYKGSGRVSITGDLTVSAEGQERVQDGGKISGVQATASAGDEVFIYATFNQPRNYAESSMVPSEFRSNAVLSIMRTISAGTYPMGTLMKPNPRGEISDLVLNLPGPQLYNTEQGSLTVESSTIIRQEGTYSLYRIRGNFNATLGGYGTGITNKHPQVSGTFDVLAVASN